MFTKDWVGTANATVAGWGNLGVSCIFEQSEELFSRVNSDPSFLHRAV
jgi:hypothetical protein